MPVEGPPLLTPPPVKRVGKVTRRKTSREIAVPFSFDRSGGVATVSDPDVQLRQHVNALMRTIPGERVMKPTFGVSLLEWVFENITPADLAAMQQLISDGFETWIPSARLVQLSGVSGPAQGVASDTTIISLQYARRYDATPTVVSADIPIVKI